MKSLREIDIKELNLNPYTLFGHDWAALTVKNRDSSLGYNSMAIAWGEMGALWRREKAPDYVPIVSVFVRPQRFTKGLIDREAMFSLSFLKDEHKKALKHIGVYSGRDDDRKIETAGLSLVESDGTAYIAGAKLVFICNKIYADDIEESCFKDRAIVESTYPNRDFHTQYIGEIVRVLIEE